MPQGSGDRKTSVTVTNVGATNPTADEFRLNMHRGHRVTRVGVFRQDTAINDTEVWYCHNDHALVVA